jgi:hypothetical protein
LIAAINIKRAYEGEEHKRITKQMNQYSENKKLNLFKNPFKGRQSFLEKQPENFSRLIHDYTDERKGYVIWKNHLEERLL